MSVRNLKKSCQFVCELLQQINLMGLKGLKGSVLKCSFLLKTKVLQAAKQVFSSISQGEIHIRISREVYAILVIGVLFRRILGYGQSIDYPNLSLLPI